MAPTSIREKLNTTYQRINLYTRQIPEIFISAFQAFSRENGAEAAASVGFYAIFSVFPLLLFVISVLGFFLVGIISPVELAKLITQAIPFSRNFIYDNLIQILNARRLSGLIGLVGLLWSGSGTFISITRNINHAWPDADRRNILQNRLLALGMVFTLFLLVLLWIGTLSLITFIPSLEIPVGEDLLLHETRIWSYSSNIATIFIAFLIFMGLYYWIPKTKVTWTEAFWGALFASITWEFTTRLFRWFLSSGLANYELVYGSLGASIGLLIWVYISSIITLYGAHICASIARIKRENDH